MPIFLKVNHQLESRMPEIGPSGSEGGAKISFAPTPMVRKKSPSRRDGVIMYSRVSLQRSCWHVLSSVMESKAVPRQSSCPSGTIIRRAITIEPCWSYERLITTDRIDDRAGQRHALGGKCACHHHCVQCWTDHDSQFGAFDCITRHVI